MLDSCRFRNLRQPGDGPRLRRFIYFATVLAETMDPILTPKPIFGDYPSDERPKFWGNRATTTPPPAADVTATTNKHASPDDATSTPSRVSQ
jgi:hypothetical protein